MTAYEKKSIASFLLIYLSSTIGFIVLVSYLFFLFQSDIVIQLTKQKMKVYAQESGGQIIDQYMRGNSRFCIAANPEFDFALFDRYDKPVLGGSAIIVIPSVEFAKIDNHYYLKDESAREHFGVKTIVIKENALQSKLDKLLQSVIISCVLAIVLFFMLGIYFAKLFLRPIREEIDRFDNFIANSAHELKTPVSAIVLISDTLKASCNDEKNLTRLKIAAKSIATIYDDLAFFSKKGEVDSFDEALELAAIISQRVELLNELMCRKNISITLSLGAFELKIDRSKITRVVDNLLTNAIKFTPNDGKISVELSDSILSIEDSGLGVAENLRDKVFDRYFRLQSNQSGFGIGLAIVKSICDEYKIDIKVETSSLGGAKFILIFPHNPGD